MASSRSVASASSVLGRDQHAGGHLVVFGLADQVGGDVHRVGGVVGQDRDLGGAGLGVDADLRAADPLGGGDVDVARPGDHVDRSQFRSVGVGSAVRQQSDGLSAADGPHLIDAEQAGGGQDGGMRQAVELRLRWARNDQRVHACGLGGHDVHHHAGRVDGVAAGHVQPDTLDRHPAFGDRCAGCERGRGVGAALVGVHSAGRARSPPRARCGRRMAADRGRSAVQPRAPAPARGARRRTTRRTPGRPQRRARRPHRRSAEPSAAPRRRPRHRVAAPTATGQPTARRRANRCGPFRAAPAATQNLVTMRSRTYCPRTGQIDIAAAGRAVSAVR